MTSLGRTASSGSEARGHCYLPRLGCARVTRDDLRIARLGGRVPVPEAGLSVGMHARIFAAIVGERWGDARVAAREQCFEQQYMPSGLAAATDRTCIERYLGPGASPRNPG